MQEIWFGRSNGPVNKGQKKLFRKNSFKENNILETGLGVLLNLFYKIAFGLSAYELVYYLAIFNEQDGGNGRDAIIHAHLRVFVNVHLTYVHFAIILFGQFINYGTDSAAWATPFRPKVNNGQFI